MASSLQHDTGIGAKQRSVPKTEVSESTVQFYDSLSDMQETISSLRRIPRPIPRPIPVIFGSRFLIWKQDPTVAELGLRTSYLPGLVLDGPRGSRIKTELSGTTPVSRNAEGDYIFPPGTPELDCAHTFAVVRQTLSMYERCLGGTRIPWAWNTNGNTEVITVFPRAGVTPNAFYSRSQKALKFFFFTPGGSTNQVFTCRSLDIVAHEAGHAILDGLKPGWLGAGNVPQTGGLHEAFGDLSAIFLALSQLDQVEALVALTKANLHEKNFLAKVAEQFGGALGRPMGLRNADNDLKLSEVSNEVHAISQVFTGAIYDILADIFEHEKRQQRNVKEPAHILLDVAQDLCGLLIRAIIAAPAVGATFADVANKMRDISAADNQPPIYRAFIRRRFMLREVVVSPVPISQMLDAELDPDNAKLVEGKETETLKPCDHVSLHAEQDRSGCCGTMQLPEFVLGEQKVLKTGKPVSEEDLLAPEIKELETAFK